MNQVIASLYGMLLSLLHAVTPFLLLYIVFADKYELAKLYRVLDGDPRFGLFVVGLIVYILITGLASTVVSINENLQQIKEKLEGKDAQGGEPT